LIIEDRTKAAGLSLVR